MKSTYYLLFVIFSCFIFISCDSCKKIEEKDSQENIVTSKNIAEITAKINKSPNNPDLYNERAKLFLGEKDINNALNDINHALEINPKNSYFYITLSDIYFTMGKAQKTQETLMKAHYLDPENTEVLFKIAELNYYFKQYKETFEYINKTLEIDPNNPKSYFIMGFVFKETGDTAKAIQNFQIAVDKDQNYYDAYIQLGILFAAQKNPLAINYYDNALNINPQSTEAWYNKGMFYQNNEMYNEAMETYNSIIEIDPNFKYAYFNLGFINLQYLNVIDVARNFFTQAIECDPNYAEAYFNRGLCFERVGDIMNAKKDYQKALDLKTNYQKAIEGLNRVDEAM